MTVGDKRATRQGVEKKSTQLKSSASLSDAFTVSLEDSKTSLETVRAEVAVLVSSWKE